MPGSVEEPRAETGATPLDWLPVACAVIGALIAASIFSSSYARPLAEQIAAGVLVLVTAIGAGCGLLARDLSPAARVAGGLCAFLLISAIVLVTLALSVYRDLN